jgi:hypothetical protein
MLNDTHQSCLEILDILALSNQLLEVICQSSLLVLELLVLHLVLFANIIELLDLSVREVKFFFSSLNVSHHVGLGLVCSLN